MERARPRRLSSTEHATDLFDDVARLAMDVGGRYVLDGAVGEVRVSIPRDPDDPIVLNPSTGSPLAISLPFGDVAGGAEILATGVIEFDNWNGSSTVPIVKNDGSVQITTVIDGAGAPESYAYDLDLPAGSAVRSPEGLSAIVTTGDDELLGGLAPAWAVDAAGMSVPAHYEVSGSRVTLVVEHTSIPAIYPVIAATWLGTELYGAPRVSVESPGFRVEIAPTPWGIANNGSAIWWAHRDEVMLKLGGATSRFWNAGIEQQLYCHIADLPTSLPTFRLESWRRMMDWAAQVTSHCDFPAMWV